MDIIKKIEKLQKHFDILNFTDKLDLSFEQREFVDSECNTNVLKYKKLNQRRVGRTHAMILRAIKNALLETEECSIYIASRTNVSSTWCLHEALIILERNELVEHVEKISKNYIEFKNGVTIKFVSYSNEDSLRGCISKYLFVDDWRSDNSNLLETNLISMTLPYNDGQAFFMCI